MLFCRPEYEILHALLAQADRTLGVRRVYFVFFHGKSGVLFLNAKSLR